jgi:predicted  nucleic acid-binding Zn-ribbon protein
MTAGVGATWPVRAVRRAIAPAALELGGRLPALEEENRRLAERLAAVEERLAAAEQRLAAVEGDDRVAGMARRADDLDATLRELADGLHESRRLSLRIAELTDVVTELVLPLHDREIDPSVLARLAPDTL